MSEKELIRIIDLFLKVEYSLGVYEGVESAYYLSEEDGKELNILIKKYQHDRKRLTGIERTD
jgi:hypothetical protein